MADTKEKALGQFKLRTTGTLGIFDTYGLGVYIPEVTKNITVFALELCKRLMEIEERKDKDG